MSKDFELNAGDYFQMGVDNLESGDIEMAIGNLRQALALAPNFVDASLTLADAYRELHAYEISNRVLYDALRRHPQHDDIGRIYSQLAINNWELGENAIAEYYFAESDLPEWDNFDDFLDSVEHDDDEPEFKLSTPYGRENGDELVKKACALTACQKYDESLELLDKVDPESNAISAANHMILVNLIMKENFDAVIINANKMLEQYGDSVSVKCALVTAYIFTNREEEAEKLLNELLSVEHNSIEEIFMILPMLLDIGRHKDVVVYTKKALNIVKLQANTMIWLSQAQYNCGDVSEAIYTMQRVQNIYGDHYPAKYYLKLYQSNVPVVEYATDLPAKEKLRRIVEVKKLLSADDGSFEDLVEAAPYDGTFFDLMRWAINEAPNETRFYAVDRLAENLNLTVGDLFKDALLNDLDYDLMSHILLSFINSDSMDYSFDVVAQGEFKTVSFTLPDATFALPQVMRSALGQCICEIIYTDEDANSMLERLMDLFNDIAGFDENGALVFKQKRYEKLPKLRSMNALAGVILAELYSDPEDEGYSRRVFMERYDIPRHMFDKYYNILFGEDDEN